MPSYWFDIDGVLGDTFSQVLHEVSAVLDVQAEPERVTTYGSLHLAWPDHTDMAYRCIQMLFDSPDFYQRIRPLPGAVEVLKALHKQGKVAGYITSRPKHTRESTKVWLSAYAFPHAQLVHAFDKSLVLRWSDGILIDDNPQTVRSVLARGANALLFRAPYNAKDTQTLKHIVSLQELVSRNNPTAKARGLSGRDDAE